MNLVTHVLLFGSLCRFNKGKRDQAVELELQTPTRLPDVLDLLKIPPHDVSLAMVNYRSVPKDSVIRPGDRLSLFPKEYPIFADWLDLRF